MPITITGDQIQFESGSGEQTTFKQTEMKNLKEGKAISSSGEFRGDRIMGTTDTTTFIDFGGIRKKNHFKRGSNAGSITFASRGRDVFHIHKNLFDFGDESLPAFVSINNMQSALSVSGSYEFTGSLYQCEAPMGVTGSIVISGSESNNGSGSLSVTYLKDPLVPESRIAFDSGSFRLGFGGGIGDVFEAIPDKGTPVKTNITLGGPGCSSLLTVKSRTIFNCNITASGIHATEPIYAPAFIETGTGSPTITSDSNLVLSASNAVVIASSPLRLRSLTNANTGSGQFTFVAGDTYFNSSTNKFMGFNGSAHIVLG